jgi:hypothetical protein
MSDVRGRPFEPGNKLGRGRPAGSRNKSTIALQELMEDSGTGIISKAKLLALNGDPTAMRLCVDRLLPPKKNRTVQVKLGNISAAAGIAVASEKVIREVARGSLTPVEGAAISSMLEQRRRFVETAELEARVKALEERGKS